MSILEVKDLKFKYEDVDLFNSVNFKINPQDHIVILGENGAGKSTFMNLIAKNLILDSGSIIWENNIKYAYLDQHLKVVDDITIIEYLAKVFKPLYDKEKKMNDYYKMLEDCDPSLYDKYLSYANDIMEDLEKNDFYSIDSKIGNVINGLGLSEYPLDTKLSILSGGSRAKVYLAKLLLDAPDVLLMDEPTNFLDVGHINWLKNYLINFKKQFVVISHDISFVKDIANVIYELNNKKFERYNMPYDKYIIEKEIRDNNYKKAYENQREFIKRQEEFIKKNIVRATTTKRAQSRRKMLEKIQLLDKPKNIEDIYVKFPYSKELGPIVLNIDNLTIGYKDKIVLKNISYVLNKNQKIAILGKNGIGKTTLIKTLLEIIPKIDGNFEWNQGVEINYFAQEEKFDNTNAINYLRYYYHLKTDNELRNILANYGIKGDLATKPLNTLSGGEQTKVRLALMSMKKANVLILDEPTNHLDIYAKASLWKAIDEFMGSVIIISHEDDFLDGLIDVKLTFND